MQKIKRSKKQQIQSFLHRTLHSNIWVLVAPLFTVVVGVSLWLVLALNQDVRVSVSRLLLQFPLPFTENILFLAAALLFLVAAVLYFWIDYHQQVAL